MSKASNQTDKNSTPTAEAKKESKLWKFLLWSIPAYTYFFGYVSQTYYLEGLGFDEAEVSGEPGSVYRFAFNSFFYINNEALRTAWPKYFETLNSNWWIAALIALGGGALFYTIFKFSYYWLLKRERNKKKNDEKNQNEKPLLMFSVFATAFSYVIHVVSVPLIIVGMTLVTVLFIPAPLVGLAMAEKEILEFTCELPKESKAKFLPCTTLYLSGGTSITGDIKHKDSDYIYIYTADGPESVPIDKIERRIRHTMK